MPMYNPLPILAKSLHILSTKTTVSTQGNIALPSCQTKTHPDPYFQPRDKLTANNNKKNHQQLTTSFFRLLGNFTKIVYFLHSLFNSPSPPPPAGPTSGSMRRCGRRSNGSPAPSSSPTAPRGLAGHIRHRRLK